QFPNGPVHGRLQSGVELPCYYLPRGKVFYPSTARNAQQTRRKYRTETRMVEPRRPSPWVNQCRWFPPRLLYYSSADWSAGKRYFSRIDALNLVYGAAG